jgi:hypothetical protein
MIAGRGGDREGRKCLIELLQFFWCMYFLGFPAWEIRSSSHIHFIFILIVPSFSHQSSTGHRTREYVMYYRGPGFLAVVWFGSFPIPFPFPVSKLSLFHSLPLCRLSSLLTEDRGRGGERGQIRWRESLVLYCIITLCTLCTEQWTLGILRSLY